MAEIVLSIGDRRWANKKVRHKPNKINIRLHALAVVRKTMFLSSLLVL